MTNADVGGQAAAADAHGFGQRLALTPAGVLHAFAHAEPDSSQRAYQSVLSSAGLPLASDWLAQGADRPRLLDAGLAAGWLQRIERDLPAPDVQLDDFLTHVIGGLSGLRKAALASTGGFCIGSVGCSAEEAEALCVAAADYAAFAQRQRQRGWTASPLVSFHDDAAMLMPITSFVPFWIDGTDYCLVLCGEPLINNPAFVELVWGIQAAGARFSRLVAEAR